VTIATRPVTWELLRDSGEPRAATSVRDDGVTTVLGVWFALGMFVDAWAHSNLPGLESFFTPWHAVFYSGFAATAGWILWLVWGQVRAGRRGRAAVPVGYGAAVVALPVFAVSGAGDLVWHTVLGIETSTNVFFSPSHLGLVGSMVVILTSPLRAAWDRYPPGSRPSVRALLPAVLTLAFAGSLLLLFLSYANPMRFDARHVVSFLSDRDDDDPAKWLVASMLVFGELLVLPLLLIARRWHLPPGAASVVFGADALISATLLGFRADRMALVYGLLATGLLVDLVAVELRPAGDRRAAFWAFGALTPFLTWAVFLMISAFGAGRAPTIVEYWTGIPVVAGLLGWLLAALMLPNAVPRQPAAA
jgi:hypothetical protein